MALRTMKQFGLAALGLTTLVQHGHGQSTCSMAEPTIQAPYPNFWAPLTDDEISSAIELATTTLNLTQYPSNLTTDINIVFEVNLLAPNKSSVLPAMVAGGAAPPRYARATIQFLAVDEPHLQEYAIGPLPVDNSTTVTPLTYPFTNSQPGRSKLAPVYTVDQNVLYSNLDAQTAPILKQLYNVSLGENNVLTSAGSLQQNPDGTSYFWVDLLAIPTEGFDSPTLLPLGIYFKLDTSSRDVNEMKVTQWYYNGVAYTFDEFTAYVNSTDFVAPKPSVDGDWTSTDRRGEPLASSATVGDSSPPPITVSQGPRRFAIDEENNYVSWMDFSFFFTTFGDQGVSLFDIQYNGQRIVYELALQEAMAHYAGSDPAKSEILYFDSNVGMGSNIQSLVKGYDCPTYATYLNASFTDATGLRSTPDGICLFEADSNYPIRRHYGNAYGYTASAKNIVFTMRWIATVGNYDYMFDYMFFYDGSMEVSVRASGYISAAYYYNNTDYGFQIHDVLSGALHDHVINFKADIDILGTKNSLQDVHLVAATESYPWSEPGQTRNTMKIERNYITCENDSALFWGPDDVNQYSIVNKDAKNKFGEYPGYRIKRGSGATYLTATNSSNGASAVNWAYRHLYVTQNKDTEPRAADRQNQYNVLDPIVDFGTFLDGDSLDQEDLVVWFNLGMHHIPHTSDLPVTLTTSAHSSMRIEPYNYFVNGDVSVRSNQQAKVNNTDGTVNTFGAIAANCSVDLTTLYDAM